MRYISLLLCFFSAVAAADNNQIFDKPVAENEVAFKQVAEKLQKANRVRARFTQSRQIEGLTKPLISSGIFLYDATLGAAWVQQAPLKIAYIVTRGGMKQLSMTPDLTSHTAPSSPVLERLSNTLISVFGGDVQELKEHFTVFFNGTAVHWTIGLKPRDSTLSSLIHSITMSGDSVTKNVSITDENEDNSNITFTEVELMPEFTSDENKFFS